MQRVLAAFVLLTLLAAGTLSAAELATVTVELHSMADERSFDGRIEAVNRATVSAETRGRIEEIRVDIGDTVPAGTVILTMTRTEQRAGLSQAEANLAEARSHLVAERAEYERIRDLYAREFVSKAELDRATARLESARARVESAEATVKTARERLSYTEVKAPYNGVVSARHVEPGEAVQPGTLLMSGYDPNLTRVEVDLPQAVAEKVREIRKARVISTTGADIIAPIEPAKLILYPVADPATSTIRARLELPPLEASEQTEHFYPGRFVTVLMMVGRTERLLIPTGSVVHRSEVTAVYIIHNGTPQLRQIRPGGIFDGQLEVLAGLRPGEMIAADPVAAAIALTSARNRTGQNAATSNPDSQPSGEVSVEQ